MRSCGYAFVCVCVLLVFVGLVLAIVGGVLLQPVLRARFLRENGGLCRANGSVTAFACFPFVVDHNSGLLPVQVYAAQNLSSYDRGTWFVGVSCELEYTPAAPPPNVIMPDVDIETGMLQQPALPGLPDFATTASYVGVQPCFRLPQQQQQQQQKWTMLAVHNVSAAQLYGGGVDVQFIGCAVWSAASPGDVRAAAVLLLLGSCLMFVGLVALLVFKIGRNWCC